MDSPDSKPKRDISDATFLTLFPALGYAVAYAYESGYTSHFGIPNYLIEVSPTLILIATASIFSALYLLLLNLPWINDHILPWFLKTPIKRAFLYTLAPVMGTILVVHLAKFEKGAWFVLSVAAFFGFFSFVFPLIINRDVKGYSNKLRSQEKTDFQVEFRHERILKASGPKVKAVLIIGLVGIALAGLRGVGVASMQAEFLTSTANPKLVVVRRYNDEFVLARYEPKTKVLTGEIVFVDPVDASEVDSMSFRMKEVGPLSSPD